MTNFPLKANETYFEQKKIKFNKKFPFREKTDEKIEKNTEKCLWGAIRRQFDYGHSQYGPKMSTRNYEDQKIRIDLKLQTSNVKQNLKSESQPSSENLNQLKYVDVNFKIMNKWM